MATMLLCWEGVEGVEAVAEATAIISEEVDGDVDEELETVGAVGMGGGAVTARPGGWRQLVCRSAAGMQKPGWEGGQAWRGLGDGAEANPAAGHACVGAAGGVLRRGRWDGRADPAQQPEAAEGAAWAGLMIVQMQEGAAVQSRVRSFACMPAPQSRRGRLDRDAWKAGQGHVYERKRGPCGFRG